jgi:hypothetical protein
MTEEDPIWLTWHEPEVADLTDDELDDYIAHWRGRWEEYRRLLQEGGEGHPNAYRWGFSQWNCSKKESIGLREIERRRITRERATNTEGQ